MPRLVPATACTSSRMTQRTEAEHLASLAGKDQIERLWRGDQDVGRGPLHPPSVAGRRVARANGRDYLGQLTEFVAGGCMVDAGQRRPKVALDVMSEGFHGRDVQNPTALGSLRGGFGEQPVDCVEEGRPASFPTLSGRGSVCARHWRSPATPWSVPAWARQTTLRTRPAVAGEKRSAVFTTSQ